MISAIQGRVPIYAVILFGFHARGQAGPYSDYDIVVIADFDELYLDRGRWVVQLAPRVPIDIFCYTPAEFEKMFSTYRLTDRAGDAGESECWPATGQIGSSLLGNGQGRGNPV